MSPNRNQSRKQNTQFNTHKQSPDVREIPQILKKEENDRKQSAAIQMRHPHRNNRQDPKIN